MFRYLLSNRAIQAGVVFFVVVVSGSLLYSWHVQRTTATDLETSPRFQQATETQDAMPGTQRDAGVSTAETPVDVDEPEAVSEASAVDTESVDIADAIFPDDVEVVSEDVPVSPYGFGPYPEIPPDYPLSVSWLTSEEEFAEMAAFMQEDLQKIRGMSLEAYYKERELMSRVGIKLWNQGVRFNGMTTSDQDGRFYPNEPDVLYVEWDETKMPDGSIRRYMMQTIGSATSALSIAAMEGREPPPDWLEIRSLDEGIEPYSFLGLNP